MRMSLMVSLVLLAGCEDPFAYAESWEHNICPSEIPADEDEALAEAIDLVDAIAYSIEWGFDRDQSLTIMPKDLIEMANGHGSEELYHELMHARQDREDGALSLARSKDEYWRMAWQIQGYRQTVLAKRAKAGGDIEEPDTLPDFWCDTGDEEFCEDLLREAYRVTHEECLDLVSR